MQGFWSMSPYVRGAEGRLSLVPNAIGRHAISDRTPGLVYGADGSLTLVLSHVPPADGTPAANWLPVPQGPFALILRAYRPQPEARDGRWMPPRPEAIGAP
jgi:hypothetical protein